MAQRISSMVLALRRKVNIKVKQPLQAIMVPVADEKQKARIDAVKSLILHEVDVKELRFVEGSGMLVKKVKCNFRTMGKKFGKLMKGIAAYMNAISQEEIATLENTGVLSLNTEGQDIVIEKEDVEIFSDDIPGWLVTNEGNLTVALEIELTDELRNEGMARELINRIQKLRKETGLEITDRIDVVVGPNAQMDAAIAAFGDFIKAQVLADSLAVADNDGVVMEFDEFNLHIQISKT